MVFVNNEPYCGDHCVGQKHVTLAQNVVSQMQEFLGTGLYLNTSMHPHKLEIDYGFLETEIRRIALETVELQVRVTKEAELLLRMITDDGFGRDPEQDKARIQQAIELLKGIHI
jgi:hypothetical protein